MSSSSISEKNDLRIDAGISLGPSAHTTISYGLTDKIAIQGFGSVGTHANGITKNGDNQWKMWKTTFQPFLKACRKS
jgi:hypothetical protein